MSRLDLLRMTCVTALFGALIAGGSVQAQERTVVANQVEVSRDDASLHLEFSDGERLDISFVDGTVTVDGQILGRYEVGGDADGAWRGLLADVLSLSNGPLARALAEWQPDPDLDPDEIPLLRSVDDALEEGVAVAATVQERVEEQVGRGEGLGSLLRLLARADYGRGLSEALESTDLDRLQVWLDEDHVIGRGETVDGTVLVVEGDLDVRGRVRGDVIVVGGSLELDEGATIDGDVRLIDSRLSRDGGEVRGTVVDVTRELERDRTRIREEVRRELERELDRSSRVRDRSHGFSSRAARAVGGVFESVLTFVLLAVLALVITHFGSDRVDSVVRAIGQNPTRSAAVGFAGSFLVLPVYILGLVVLAVSIVGIPALLIWAPIFPLAVALGAFVGYMGVGHYVGQWVLDREFTWLDWVDRNNDASVRLVGLGALLVPFAAASLLRVVPLVGWMGGIVSALGSLACLAALVTGFGAVIITRGGRYSSYGFDIDGELRNWSGDTVYPDDGTDAPPSGTVDDEEA